MKKQKPFLFLVMMMLLSCSLFTQPQPTENGLNASTTDNHATTGNNWTNTLTNTSITSATNTPTGTKKMTPTNPITPLLSLLPGRYIVYTKEEPGDKFFKYIISEEGVKQGLLAKEGVPYISPDQQIIAYSHWAKIELLYLSTGTSNALNINDECLENRTELSWNPSSEMIAIACNWKIIIVSIPSGDILGEISKYYDEDTAIWYLSPKWSVDGKWIAYYVLTSSQTLGTKGPIVTEASCISDSESCKEKTKLIVNAVDSIIEWTPDNYLAIVYPHDMVIKVYDVETNTIKKNIIIPQELKFIYSMTWSPDNEWIALGTWNGIYKMSVKTGEISLLTEESNQVNFWYIVKE